MRKTGNYQKSGNLDHFIPNDLPPSEPEFILNAELMDLHGKASLALGQLNEIGEHLPNPQRFIKAYVIKEALLSSEIEGIHTTLIDVFSCTTKESKPDKNTQLVLNYTKALNVALEMLNVKNLPLVSRIILTAHKTLLSEGENENKAPGDYRKQSVLVGNLVPPPATEVPRLMSSLEKYINEASDLPALIRAGLVHAQFETIHPFLDGNGRIGRLLIVLMLIDNKLLNLPILYPSYYFKKYHLEYYQKLDLVRIKGDFEGWITYYLKAILNSAQDAYQRAKDIEKLDFALKSKIQSDDKFIKMRDTASIVLEILFDQPVTNIIAISEKSGKAYNTIANTLKHFVKSGVISEHIINKRNKTYRFDQYIALLEKEYKTSFDQI